MRHWTPTHLTSRSPSPNHFDVIADMLTLMKCAPLSLATALASIVLPVPGGPNSSRPAAQARTNQVQGQVRGSYSHTHTCSWQLPCGSSRMSRDTKVTARLLWR